MILAEKITEERKKNGWSQEELAERLGVSRQSVSKWESAGSIPDLQKVIQLAGLFGVSTDYLLKDTMEREDREDRSALCAVSGEPDAPLRRVTMEEANAFLAARRMAAPRVANAAALCILSPVLLLLLSALTEGGLLPIRAGLAAGLGCAALLLSVAAAVFLFITCGNAGSRWSYLEREAFETEYGVTGMVKEKRRAYELRFSRGIAAGVVLCILSAVPLIVAGAMDASDPVCELCTACLLALVALGVDLMIRVSTIKGSYDTLLQEGEFSQKEKRARSKLSAFSGAYWCLATAIYLGWSFLSGRWDLTWIVWPVAGVLFAAASGVARALLKLDEP